MNINIRTNNNGYVVEVEGSIKYNGEFVYRNTDEILMLEFVANVLLDKKMRVEYR